uniref:Uncharacterized protein n=1 Tax=Oryza punctata TaxID=4537 RepID=A0A0E0LQK0_ORYPU
MAVARAAARSPSPAAKALAGAARTPSHQGSRHTPHYDHRMLTYDSPPAKPASAPGHQGVYLPMFLTPLQRAASAPARNGVRLVSPDMCQPLLPPFVTTSPSATAKWSLPSTLVPPSIRTRPPKRAPKSPDFLQWDCPRPHSLFSAVPSAIHCTPPQAHCTLKVVSGLSEYYSAAADANTFEEFKITSWRAMKGRKSHSSKKRIAHKVFRLKRNFNKMMYEQGNYVGDSMFD